MRVGNVAVIVPQGREKESGYVLVEHGQKYTLQLQNHWNDRRCDAVVTIDGKDMGTFRIDNFGKIVIERPVHDAGCFTFYKADTAEYAAAAGGDVRPDLRGLISVVFKPEKRRQHQMIAPSVVVPRDAFDRQGSRQYTRGGEEKTSGGIVLPPDGFKGGHERKLLSRGPCGQSQQMNMSAGATGLSGHSDQRFLEVAELDYDPAEEVTVNLRLVAWDGGPRPLTSASPKSNPVPAPVV